MDRIILLNKPQNMTSFQAAARLKRIFHEKKIGHTGTLDPNATGLLIMLMGKYTKLAPYCVKDHKAYTAEFSFGTMTDTGDIWGKVIGTKETGSHTEEELRHAAESFVGDIEQIPPMYSAIKINGRKLYELARKGETVEREPRHVHISELSITVLGENHYRMDAVVSGGTYIRTLIMDYAASLGEFGVMTALTRKAIEHVSLEESVTIEELEKDPDLMNISPLQVLDPSYELVAAEDEQWIRNGRPIRLDGHNDEVIICSNDEILAAYGKREDGMYYCLRGLF